MRGGGGSTGRKTFAKARGFDAIYCASFFFFLGKGNELRAHAIKLFSFFFACSVLFYVTEPEPSGS